MKVVKKISPLLIIPSFYPAVIYGGPIFSTLNTCKELKKQGCFIKVCTTNANGNKKLEVLSGKYTCSFGFPVKYYNETIIGKFSASLFVNLWKDIKEVKVVHIQSIFSTPTPIALFYCFLLNKTILLSPRGSLGAWCIGQGSLFKKLWLSFLIKPFLKKVTWHATAEQEKQEIICLFGIKQRVEIIPNGIDANEFLGSNIDQDFFLKQYGVKPTEKIVVSIGRIEKKKGFDILIRAIALLNKDFESVKLYIAGPDYGEKATLQSLVSDLNIGNSVTFVGSIKGQEKIDFLGAADVFAMPSHNENFGNVYAEALACGTPIVASTNTPWQEVEEAGCGHWVENTPEKTAVAIESLLNGNRDELRNCSKRYIAKFDWKYIASSFKKVYEKLSD